MHDDHSLALKKNMYDYLYDMSIIISNDQIAISRKKERFFLNKSVCIKKFWYKFISKKAWEVFKNFKDEENREIFT